jgi:SDR family mycofactocin-dependent oxidoreductase
MGSLDGKVALISGAARTQGRAHALTLAGDGADVVIFDIGHDIEGLQYPLGTESELEQVAKEVEALGHRVIHTLADVRSQAEVDAVVSIALAEFGHIDIAVANAGIISHAPVWDLTEEQWSTMVDINLSGVWRTAKVVVPAMRDHGGGSIIMISSVNGLEPGEGYAHYIAAKHGVIGLMKSLALEGAPHGIRCNAICPGFVKSGMTTFQAQLDKFAGHPGGTEADFDHAGRSFHPTRDLTWLEPQGIADAAHWLASDGAAAVTGVALPVDAGHLLMPGTYSVS